MEKRLKIAFILSLIGILLLIFISNQIKPDIIDIDNVNRSYLGKEVAIVGEFVSINDYDGFQVAIVKDDTGIIKVTMNSDNPINKTENKTLIIGKVVEYKEEIEIEADFIKKIN